MRSESWHVFWIGSERLSEMEYAYLSAWRVHICARRGGEEKNRSELSRRDGGWDEEELKL